MRLELESREIAEIAEIETASFKDRNWKLELRKFGQIEFNFNSNSNSAGMRAVLMVRILQCVARRPLAHSA